MKVGNHPYESANDLPGVIPVFPLPAALLLPGSELPLNIFEPRYLAMVDAALCGDRIIGMIQPDESRPADAGDPALCTVGCAGRLTAFSESGDGRYLITLTGIARFSVVEEIAAGTDYRQCRIDAGAYACDFGLSGEAEVDRDAVLKTFCAYLKANSFEADWDSVNQASNRTLVNTLAMMAPFGTREKQALLEAPDLKTRAETLVALTEMTLARDSGGPGRMQ